MKGLEYHDCILCGKKAVAPNNFNPLTYPKNGVCPACIMIRQCLICRTIFNDADLIEDAQLSNILILCNRCYLDRVVMSNNRVYFYYNDGKL